MTPAEPFRTFFHRDNPDAHAQLQAWRAANPDGFLLNRVSPEVALLHRTECQHLGDTVWASEGGGDLVRKLKVCSLSIAALRRWATQHGVSTVSACADCRPAEGQGLVAAEAASLDREGDFDPADIADARTKAIRAIAIRQGQPAFRQKLLDAYQRRCAVTGCQITELLEAAHIVPYKGPLTNHPQNGLLLRVDIHNLYDWGLITVDTSTMTVLIAPGLAQSEYAELQGRPLHVPLDDSLAPNKTALDHQRYRCDWSVLGPA